MIYANYYNFGRCDFELVREREVEFRVSGYPAMMAPRWQYVATAFVARLLELSGVDEGWGDWSSLERDGDRDGVNLARLCVRVRWR